LTAKHFRSLVNSDTGFVHLNADAGFLPMNRFVLISLLASTAAWILIRSSHSPNRVIPAAEAATKLQQAWADHHTTA
jgi:hypothetical protein